MITKLSIIASVFREGDLAACWYIVLQGRVAVTGRNVLQRDTVDLAVGMMFGESIDRVQPHSCTVIVRRRADLLRMEHYDFKQCAQRYGRTLIDSCVQLCDVPHAAVGTSNMFSSSIVSLTSSTASIATPTNRSTYPPVRHATPVARAGARPTSNNHTTDERQRSKTAQRIVRAARLLRARMLLQSAELIRDRRHHGQLHTRSMVGCEMVDWLMALAASLASSCLPIITTAQELDGGRMRAVGIWQVLFEAGAVGE